jgi:small subunit ribosomal protein S5
MRHEIIDPNQFELTDKVVSIKRVSKTVKGGHRESRT